MRYCGRPFFTTDQCDLEMIKRWNALVKPEDTVYHIGDVALHLAPIKRILHQLNGTKILVVGNHDLMYPYFLKKKGLKFVDKMTREYLAAGFSQILQGPVRLNPEGYIKIRLCHFPTKNAIDNYNCKHMSSRPDDERNTLNICGHVHQNWLKHGNNVNVGVDVCNFKPVSLETILTTWYNPSNIIGNPNPIRVRMWKLYHTAIWYGLRFKNLLLGKVNLNKNK